jgi:hypothetical protein
MKIVSKSNQKQGGLLGKRDAPEGKNAATSSVDMAVSTTSTSKEMEAELLRLMKENDKLKNQLSDSQGEVNPSGPLGVNFLRPDVLAYLVRFRSSG